MHTRLFFLILFALHLNASGQDSKLAALDSFSLSLINNVRANEGEQAHLVTDKTIYAAGTPVWFRAFLLRSVAEKISTRSKHLFVDLVNEQDSILLQAVLSAGTQQTSGRLGLPSGLSTGYYWLRAYSRSIINGNPTSAAVVPIYIINPLQPALTTAAKKTAEAQQPIVEMFPEGGHLVTGINTTLTLFVHDDANSPLLLNGYIKDNRDSVVASFSTNRSGLAKTSFAPTSFRKYHAVVNYKEKEYRFPLPAFNRFAGQLAAQTTGNRLQLRVILEDSIYRKDAVTYLVGLSKDSVCFTSIGYGAYEASVALDKYPKGIASFFLFDKNFGLLSERQVYIREDHLQVGLSMDKPAYRKGSKAILAVNVLNRLNQPVPASLAVTVADSNTLINFDEDAALNLVKKIKEAKITNWDLLHNTSLSDEEIDLFLLTNRSHYNHITAKRNTQADAADDSLFYIQGQLLNEKGQPLSNQALSLISRTGTGVFEAATTNAAGHFSFPLLPYADSTQFIIQLDNAKRGLDKSKIVLKSFPFPRFQTPPFLKQKPGIPTARQMALLKKYTDTAMIGEGSEWLKPVNLNTASRSQIIDPRRKNPSSAILTSADLMKLGTGNIGLGIMRIPGAQLVNGLLRFYGPDQFFGANRKSEPMVLLDGNQISINEGPGATSSPVIQYLNTLNPREIDFIEVLKGPEASMFGIRGGEGVIIINTSKEIHQDFVSKEGNVYKFFKQGYLKPAEFVVAQPSEKRGQETALPDTRSTLYWNENELADGAGKAVFTFFTNDLPGVYKIVVTGITVNGDLIYKPHTFITSLSGQVK